MTGHTDDRPVTGYCSLGCGQTITGRFVRHVEAGSGPGATIVTGHADCPGRPSPREQPRTHQ